jgi:hypothetical protein
MLGDRLRTLQLCIVIDDQTALASGSHPSSFLEHDWFRTILFAQSSFAECRGTTAWASDRLAAPSMGD